jgi:hypothetical protein
LSAIVGCLRRGLFYAVRHALAYTAVGANGIIAALDPGKYGPLTIVGPITVNGNGWAAITGPAGGSGVIINASFGNIALIGLEVDGVGAAYNGIVFNSGDSLTVTNCTVQNFVENDLDSLVDGNGILIFGASGTENFFISNTTVSNNQNSGIYFFTPDSGFNYTGTIDHVSATGNFVGITLNAAHSSSGTMAIALSNDIASSNPGAGIAAYGSSNASLDVTIDNLNANGNGDGIQTSGSARVLLGRSVITRNSSYGIDNGTPNAFYTYQDNKINLNAHSNVVNGSPLTSLSFQ